MVHVEGWTAQSEGFNVVDLLLYHVSDLRTSLSRDLWMEIWTSLNRQPEQQVPDLIVYDLQARCSSKINNIYLLTPERTVHVQAGEKR